MRGACCLFAGLMAMFSVGIAASQSTDRNCDDFESHAEAQAYFESKGGSPSNNVDYLDGDRDGVACEALVRRGRVERVVDGIMSGGPLVLIGGLGAVVAGAVAGVTLRLRRRGTVLLKSNRTRLADPVAAPGPRSMSHHWSRSKQAEYWCSR